MVPKAMIFSTFFENVDFVKIGVSSRREQRFSGSEPLKIKPKLPYKLHRKNNAKSMQKLLVFYSILASSGRSGASLGCIFGVLKQAFFNEQSKAVPKRSFGDVYGRFGREIERIWGGPGTILE